MFVAFTSPGPLFSDHLKDIWNVLALSSSDKTGVCYRYAAKSKPACGLVKPREERRKHQTASGRGKMKGKSRLLCHRLCWVQIILNLCLSWTCIPSPPPRISAIKHDFISLHPFEQFGHINLCSGISPVVIYEPSVWIHQIYTCADGEENKHGIK